jgi:hypothetical protein
MKKRPHFDAVRALRVAQTVCLACLRRSRDEGEKQSRARGEGNLRCLIIVLKRREESGNFSFGLSQAGQIFRRSSKILAHAKTEPRA